MNVLDDRERKGEKAQLWRLPDPGEPELLRARFRTRTFARHAHERFAIGVIEAGGLTFRYRGETIVAPAGWVNLAFPGEAHSGQATGPEGWSYRMFYLDPVHMALAARDLDPAVQELPFIPAGAVWDPDLASAVAGLHHLCSDPASEPLARQAGLGLLIQRLLLRHGAVRPEPRAGRAREQALRVRKIIDEQFETPIQLAHLAASTGMNPYTLVRCFTRELGLPPHAYLVQVRVNRAAALLRRGSPPGMAAVEAGFADQSHLNRHFVRHFGVTPGAYRRAFYT